MPQPIPRSIVAAATLAVSVVGFAAQAVAHVDPDPASVPAGASVTVGFLVEHGCDDSGTSSATTSVAIRMPEGVAEARPVDKAGWLVALEDNVAIFVGGPLDATTEDTFSVSFVVPNVAGPLVFPVVQTCEVGEIVWGEVVEPGQPEPDSPPAVVEVVVAPDAAATAAPAPADAPTEMAQAATVPPTIPAVAVTPVTAPISTTAPSMTTPAAVAITAAPTTLRTTGQHRSGRDLLIGATVGTAITAAIAVALNRRPR